MNELRVIESNIGKVTPIIDIADSIGYDRTTIAKIIKSNSDIFGGTEVFCPLPTSGGDQNFRCVNRVGLDRLMILLKPARTRDSFEKFMEFKERALDRLNGDRLPAVNTPTKEGNGHDLETEISKAKLLASKTGIDVNKFLRIALKNCGCEDYIPALESPPITHGDAGVWMNPTDIGRECGLKAHEVNGWLYNKGYQWPDHGIWRLTDRGEVYGEEYNFQTTSRHSEIRIRWHRAILVASGLKKATIENLLPAPARV